MKKGFFSLLLVLAVVFVVASSAFAGEVVHAKKASAPTIDGVAEGVWNGVPGTTIKIDRIPEALVSVNKKHQTGKYAKHWKSTQYTEISEMELKAIYTDDSVFFLARWKDDTKDDQHKPMKWTGGKDDGEYIDGPEREDRLSMRFPISGDFNACMLSPVEYVADVWQWKASRVNGLGILHNKSHHYTKTEPKGKFSTHYTADGSPIYVSRPGDGGVSPYKSNKVDPFTYQGDVVRKYIPEMPDNADATDVKAQGAWKDGYWTVEMGRKLDTGNHETDTVFETSRENLMDVAVFNHVGDHFHSSSGIVKLVFDK